MMQGGAITEELESVKAYWAELAGVTHLRVEPDGGAEGLPLIIAIHGRGADATDLAGLASELHPDRYQWVLPQGPRPVPLAPGYTGWAWYDLGASQTQTVIESRDLLTRFVDGLLTKLGVPRSRTLIMGFSQGAVMAMHVGLSSPEPFAGVVAMSGHLPGAEELTPILPERLDRKLLMVHGTRDSVLSIDVGRRAHDIMEKAGLKPEYHEFDMDHQITAESLAVVRDFIERVLPANAAEAANP
jgi:phospholipase/carboxylesterase